jgi:hypothetical protein
MSFVLYLKMVASATDLTRFPGRFETLGEAIGFARSGILPPYLKIQVHDDWGYVKFKEERKLVETTTVQVPLNTPPTTYRIQVFPINANNERLSGMRFLELGAAIMAAREWIAEDTRFKANIVNNQNIVVWTSSAGEKVEVKEAAETAQKTETPPAATTAPPQASPVGPFRMGLRNTNTGVDSWSPVFEYLSGGFESATENAREIHDGLKDSRCEHMVPILQSHDGTNYRWRDGKFRIEGPTVLDITAILSRVVESMYGPVGISDAHRERVYSLCEEDLALVNDLNKMIDTLEKNGVRR